MSRPEERQRVTRTEAFQLLVPFAERSPGLGVSLDEDAVERYSV